MSSWRRLSWTSMSLHASFTRWRSVTSRLYVTTRNSPMRTRAAMTTSVISMVGIMPLVPRARRPRSELVEQRPHRRDDVLRGDPRGVEQLRGLARPRHLTHGEVAVAQAGLAALRERGEGGVADAALDPVILDDDDPAARRLRRGHERLAVDRLHGVRVDDTDAHAVLRELVGRDDRLVQRDARGDHGDAVVGAAAAHDLAAADRERLLRAVDDRGL